MRQLILSLGHRPAHGAADFIVGASNREAMAWIDRWPDWPSGGLVIAGPPASGKSHLVAVWQARSKATVVAATGLTDSPDLVALVQHGAVAVEDADRGVDERALLHLYNLMRERRGHLLLTARNAPARWGLVLPDLRSRMATLPVAVLAPPDDDVLATLIVKLFADRQVRVEPDLVAYLVARLDRSFAAVAGAVAALDATALAQGRAVTIPLAKAVLGA